MSQLPDHVERSIRVRGLLTRGQRVLVAVSGGVDSMVLLHILHDLAPRHSWHLTVAHLNHALRGRSSDADERLVRRTAESLVLQVRADRLDVRQFARLHGLSLEMAARKARHEFLARTAAQLGISRIALAHQADDQIELFFLRLLRGSSGEGLAGMRWHNPSPSDRKIELVRPFLDVPRASLLAYAAERGIRFREDASNACLDIQRNRIRHELLPLLRAQYQPALSRVILRTADVLGADAEFATQAAMAWLNRLRKRPRSKNEAQGAGDWPGLLDPSASFEAMPVAVQRRVVQLQLIGQGIAADYPLIEALRSTADKPVTIGPGPPGKLLPDCGSSPGAAVDVVRDRAGMLHLRTREAHMFKADSVPLCLTGRAGQTEFAGARFEWRIGRFRWGGKPLTLKGREAFDADKVGSSILLRHWRPGDRFQPIGMGRRVKLQDFFTNQKVPPGIRRRLVVAARPDGEVFWVEGMRISEGVKLTKGTIRRLHWFWRRL